MWCWYTYRSILVVYAHRGLVQNGYPNLKLFNCLHWLFFSTMVSYNFGVFPLSHLLKGNFPGNSSKGQICMKLDLQLGEMNNKQRFYGIFGSLLLLLFIFRFWKYCTDYVKENNLKMKTFSQFGGTYQRNLFTFQQTYLYLVVVMALILLDNLFILIFQRQEGKLDKRTQFIIHNFPWVVVCELFFGIYIPIKHIFSSRHHMPSLWWESKEVISGNFYVREDKLIPRRDFEPSLKTVQSEGKERSFAYIRRHSFKVRRNVFERQPVTFYKVIRTRETNLFSRETVPSLMINVQPLSGDLQQHEYHK